MTNTTTIDSLTFTSRDELGRINWFDIEHPDNNSLYDWHEQYKKGMDYARELKELLPEIDKLNGSEVAFICSTIARNAHKLPDGLYEGFFQELVKYEATTEQKANHKKWFEG